VLHTSLSFTAMKLVRLILFSREAKWASKLLRYAWLIGALFSFVVPLGITRATASELLLKVIHGTDILELENPTSALYVCLFGGPAEIEIIGDQHKEIFITKTTTSVECASFQNSEEEEPRVFVSSGYGNTKIVVVGYFPIFE